MANEGKTSPAQQSERFRRTRRDHASETAEDYVEIVDELLDAHGEARLVDIARRLGITHVTANRTIARLQREGLLQTKPYRAIFLTEEGRKLAGRSRKRHRTVVEFLESIGVPSTEAALDAEGIEHHVSAATLRRMRAVSVRMCREGRLVPIAASTKGQGDQPPTPGRDFALHIRPERPTDHAAIADVIQEAFAGDDEVHLAARLRNDPNFDADLSLVAIVNDKVVGYVLFSLVGIEHETRSTAAVALAPLAVLPAFQGIGIGAALVREGLGMCRAKRHGIVIVLGEPAYYVRFGFTSAPERGVRAPFPVPDDAFMVLELVHEALRGVTGRVKYAPAFDEL